MATAAVLVSALAAFEAKPAAAESIVLTLSTDFGNNSGSGFPTVKFDDHGGTGSVDLLMSLTGLSDTDEFVTEWFFNSSIDPAGFGITYVGGSSTGPAADSVLRTFNSGSDYKADGVGGYHDLEFNFSSSAANRFNQGEYVMYTITGTGITASTFNVVGIPSGGGSYVSAVHLQGTSDASTWLGTGPGTTTVTHVPEPATLALLGMGMAGFAARRRLKRGQQTS